MESTLQKVLGTRLASGGSGEEIFSVVVRLSEERQRLIEDEMNGREGDDDYLCKRLWEKHLKSIVSGLGRSFESLGFAGGKQHFKATLFRKLKETRDEAIVAVRQTEDAAAAIADQIRSAGALAQDPEATEDRSFAGVPKLFDTVALTPIASDSSGPLQNGATGEISMIDNNYGEALVHVPNHHEASGGYWYSLQDVILAGNDGREEDVAPPQEDVAPPQEDVAPPQEDVAPPQGLATISEDEEVEEEEGEVRNAFIDMPSTATPLTPQPSSAPAWQAVALKESLQQAADDQAVDSASGSVLAAGDFDLPRIGLLGKELAKARRVTEEVQEHNEIRKQLRAWQSEADAQAPMPIHVVPRLPRAPGMPRLYPQRVMGQAFIEPKPAPGKIMYQAAHSPAHFPAQAPTWALRAAPGVVLARPVVAWPSPPASWQSASALSSSANPRASSRAAPLRLLMDQIGHCPQ